MRFTAITKVIARSERFSCTKEESLIRNEAISFERRDDKLHTIPQNNGTLLNLY